MYDDFFDKKTTLLSLSFLKMFLFTLNLHDAFAKRALRCSQCGEGTLYSLIAIFFLMHSRPLC